MARKLSMAFLAAIVIAAFIQISAAQSTSHVVGGGVGWAIPPGGATVYSTWAANQTFAVGDTLVFNFANNQHDVAKVTKANYDACTANNPISVVSTSPARITINATGEHYFICNFPGHCSAGQKLMINVSAATATTPAPAPQPSSPSPSPSPSPPPPPQSTTPPPVSAPSPTPVSTPPPTTTATPPTTTSTPPTTSTSPPSPTPPSSPSPSGTNTPPPPDSSAKSLGVAGLSATLLSIAVAFLY